MMSTNCLRAATVEIFETICGALGKALDAREAGKSSELIPPQLPVKKGKNPLKNVDLSQSISREDYKNELGDLQEEIRELAHQIYERRIPVVVVYEGWDAAGKGGNIKRLTQSMDPRGYEVTPVGAPAGIEKRHHYLWRFWQAIPKAGHVGIFDRSWYGRVLVERVEGFCTETEWRRAYQEINEFESQLINYGTVLIKFWLHIDKEEQLRRFEARNADPHKKWKITEEDWRNRERWDQYQEAVRDMLIQTSTETAPWTVVESNSKYHARLKALRTVVAAIRPRL
jgi:polyphosphate kinase 2 (PPK2 family)